MSKTIGVQQGSVRGYAVALASSFVMIAACGDETAGGSGGSGGAASSASVAASSTSSAGGSGDGGAGGGAPACGPEALCARTIEECEEEITPAACAGFYADEGNCADMAAYVACNCECYEEATCSDYFACGNLCFNENCK